MTLKAQNKSLTENSHHQDFQPVQVVSLFRRVGGATSGGFVSYLGDVGEGEASLRLFSIQTTCTQDKTLHHFFDYFIIGLLLSFDLFLSLDCFITR